MRSRLQMEQSRKIGRARRKYKRNETESPEYVAWSNIKQRCLNKNDPSYVDWGGRGITIYEPWRDSYEVFLKDVGRRPRGIGWSLNRIDNNGDYTPGNIEWATSSQQNKNRRPFRRT